MEKHLILEGLNGLQVNIPTESGVCASDGAWVCHHFDTEVVVAPLGLKDNVLDDLTSYLREEDGLVEIKTYTSSNVFAYLCEKK